MAQAEQKKNYIKFIGYVTKGRTDKDNNPIPNPAVKYDTKGAPYMQVDIALNGYDFEAQKEKSDGFAKVFIRVGKDEDETALEHLMDMEEGATIAGSGSIEFSEYNGKPQRTISMFANNARFIPAFKRS